jgi:tRNA dimethylallyltransferase
MTKLIVICGATATGKSSLALALAMRLGSVIISADSRQVYRKFDIGTAKPTVAEQKLVPHYLIDICDPTDTMTVADYQEQTQALIASVDVTPLLLVGGTGLYIRSIVQGMKIPRVAPQIELRSQLESLGQLQLYAMLQQVDPVAAQKIHANDSVRTLRALEVYYVTGYPISKQQGENPPNYPILQIGLDCDVEKLGNRIKQRTDQMIADGLVAEVEYLCQKYGVDLSLLNTLGYQEIKQYLAGDISLDEAKELIVLHTRQFAKRQRTWFRAYPQIEWFDANNPELLDKVWHRINEFTNCTHSS